MRRKLSLSMSGVALLSLAACADLDPGAQRAMTGGLAGAGAGALVGSFSGNAGLGAATGAGLGAGGGFVYDRHVRARDRAFEQGVQAGRTQR
ncbi:glycine zipper domain-containing protein [Falsiroseomonas sp. HC035]|uniref:glycine zipper domain-containing protein n=1 Tax=Falsiroseomonas sp. HC035 TaxID=3390999 RepID=UPI003D31CE23